MLLRKKGLHINFVRFSWILILLDILHNYILVYLNMEIILWNALFKKNAVEISGTVQDGNLGCRSGTGNTKVESCSHYLYV